MKKNMILVLCLVLIAGMVFAGGSSQKPSPAAAGGLEEFTATFIKGSYHGEPNDMILFKEIEKETNVKVNWQVIPSASWSERRSIMVNSGDLPDVFYLDSFGAAEVDRYGTQGLFVDLSPYIKQYAPRLQALFDANPYFKAVCTNPSDGKIYNISRAHNRAADMLNGQLFIYKPWLDKLGLSIPKDYNEFYNMLKAFKTRDPNGNGLADELPFVFSGAYGGNTTLTQLFAMFGYGYQGVRPNKDSFVEAKGKAVFVPGTENFKEAIIWLHKLFAEGLLSQEDYAARDMNLERSKLAATPIVAGSFTAFSNNTSYVPADRGPDYVRIEIPMKGPHGDQIYMQDNKLAGVGGGAFIVTNKAKNIPAIMRWLDAHFESRRSIEMLLGPVGTNLIEKNGMLTYAPVPAGSNYNQFRYSQAPVFGPHFVPASAWGTTVEIMDEDKDRLPWVQGILKPYLTQYFIYSYPIDAETRYLQGRGNEIEEYVKNTQAKWLIEGGIEREWDAFQARLKSMGVDEYTRIMQNQIDRFEKYSK
jgi:putative aldouronate transport system substrate-binding protein